MPALAIAEALRRHAPPASSRCSIGAVRGVEAQLLPTARLPLSPAARRADLPPPVVEERPLALRGIGLLPRSCASSFGEEQPVAVLGTGGMPARRWSGGRSRLGIPTAIQEQNAYPGLSQLAGSRSGCEQIYLGLPEAMAHFDKGTKARMIDTGNPIATPTPARRRVRAPAFRHQAGAPRGAGHRRQPGCARDQPGGGGLDRGRGAAQHRHSLGHRAREPTQQFKHFHEPPHVQVISTSSTRWPTGMPWPTSSCPGPG